jgi:nucleoside phosphorylase
MTLKQCINSLISDGKTGQAIKEFLEATEKNGQSDLNGYLILLSGRFNRNETQNRTQTIDPRDYNLELNRISNTLRDYTDQFEDDGSFVCKAMKTEKTEPAQKPESEPEVPDRFVPLPKPTHPKPKYDEIAFEEVDAYSAKGLILLVTATETETKALHQKMVPLSGQMGLLEAKKDNATYFIGKFGNFAVANVECGTMGSVSSMGSTLTVANAIDDLKPKFVLMVGIAFGINSQKQNIGDVLVSNQIIPYEIQRVGEDGIVSRASKPEASNSLRNSFKNIRDWEYQLPNGEEAKVELCDILSGEKLVDNLDFRKALETSFPTAKGGEMEGAGLYAACQDRRVDWILVKSICDFADGKKGAHKAEKQHLAIETALHTCLHVFNKKFVFEGLGMKVYEA